MIEKINELEEMLNKIKADNIITPKEIDSLQDWVDENGVVFCDNKACSNVIIILQRILEDGEMRNNEFEEISKIIEQLKKSI